MIIEQHYDEEVLIGLLEAADRDSHVPGCETCAYRDIRRRRRNVTAHSLEPGDYARRRHC